MSYIVPKMEQYNLMSLDANDLILFSCIVEAGSFSRAADITGLPKSTLSRRITMLEAQLGERLLIRSTRRLTVTEFGEQMLVYGKRLSEETEAASAMALHRQELPRGLLRVSMPPDFADLNLTPMLLRFAASYPEVRLELDLSPRRVDLVSERFDLAIRVASRLPDDNTLVARKLGTLRLHLYASPAYLKQYGEPEKPDDLFNHVCLRLVSGNGEAQPWRLSSTFGHWDGMPGGPLASNSLGLQRDLALHGMGIVGLADRFVAGWVEKGLLRPVLPEWALPEVTIWCVTPGRRLLPARTTVFIEMLRSVFDKEANL